MEQCPITFSNDDLLQQILYLNCSPAAELHQITHVARVYARSDKQLDIIVPQLFYLCNKTASLRTLVNRVQEKSGERINSGHAIVEVYSLGR